MEKEKEFDLMIPASRSHMLALKILAPSGGGRFVRRDRRLSEKHAGSPSDYGGWADATLEAGGRKKN
jgi:hypothetical protein